MQTLSAEARTRQARLRLKTARRQANCLLLAAVVLFVVSALLVRQYAWLAYVKAFAEAAMVGALADWFAVTALFRRPLGLPIPHTAILPRNQVRIADELARFIEHNFLQGKAIAVRIYQMRPSEKLLHRLAEPPLRRLWLPWLTRQIPLLLNTAKPEQTARFGSMLLSRQYSGEKIGRALADGLKILKEHGFHHILLHKLIKQLRRLLNHPETRAMLEQHLREWAAKIESDAPTTWDKFKAAMKTSLVEKVDDWAAEKALSWADGYLAHTADGRDNALQRHFDTQYDLLIERLSTSKLWHKRLETFKQQIAESPALHNGLADFWRNVQNWAAEDTAKQHSLCAAQLEKLLEHMLAQAAAHPQFMRRADVRLSLLVRGLVARYKNQAAQFVADKVKSWDSGQMAEKLELGVGRDLQYIRINGTLVGGLVGLLIYCVSQFLM
ncbi:DUF445 domain-containing protein [Neisseria animalis]|uniref:DUF445 domain-containing protein n=1 Tax=Neisseria animalis TaxID=492 RepID=A0A5P3MUJ8_NEIAN|nr:DUF445 domain-containing protein [Neisseria animalis]QEY24431.1 DUF445 domain-containing protein [Neisseria animalis]ROW31906.1 DUF445 domain-containing protein [Neisseria animalis]VEE07046.1 Predicted membrane protein [Neisseria animalis]